MLAANRILHGAPASTVAAFTGRPAQITHYGACSLDTDGDGDCPRCAHRGGCPSNTSSLATAHKVLERDASHTDPEGTDRRTH